jgi:hypothetical protein
VKHADGPSKTEFSIDVRLIVGAVVREDTADPNAVSSIPSECSIEKVHCRVALLVGQDFDVGESRRIVDADMCEFPAGSVDSLAAIAVNPMSHVTSNPGKLFHVQVEQVARPFVRVPIRRFGRFEQTKALQARTLQDPSDRSLRHLQATCNLWTCLPGPAQTDDQVFPLCRRSSWAAARARRSISQTRRTFQPIAGQPLVDSPPADSQRCGGLLDRSSFPQNPPDEKLSTDRGSPGQTVDVHPGFLSGELTVSSPSASPKRSRMDNYEL